MEQEQLCGCVQSAFAVASRARIVGEVMHPDTPFPGYQHLLASRTDATASAAAVHRINVDYTPIFQRKGY